jgi:Hint domain
MSTSFYVRADSTTAKNPGLNPVKTNGTGGFPVTKVTFVANGPDGDEALEANGGKPDSDTLLQINGKAYPFTVVMTGKLTKSPMVPDSLVGRTVMLVKVTINGIEKELFFVLGDPPATAEEMAAIGNGAIKLEDVNTNPPPYCFAAGTRIATPWGERAVETLRKGDVVQTEDGRRARVVWIGHSRYDQLTATSNPAIRPICIRADAFGPGLPRNDLVVSPHHRIVVEGAECELLFGTPRVFVIARHLPPSMAHSPAPKAEVNYYHLLLKAHDVVLANGLPAESFQPARRMINAIAPETRASLELTLDRLGAKAMLTRPDACLTLTAGEARVLGQMLVAKSRRKGSDLMADAVHSLAA